MSKITSKRSGADLVLAWKNDGCAGPIFCIVGLVFTLVAFFMVMGEGGLGLFNFIFGLLGPFALYIGLVHAVNTNELVAGPRQVAYRSYPIPYFGNKTVNVSDIDQLFVRQNGSETVNNKTTYHYAVFVLLKNKKQVQLTANLPDKDIALSLESTVENYLGLQDRPLDYLIDPRLKKFAERFPDLINLDVMTAKSMIPQPINEGKETVATENHIQQTPAVPPRLIPFSSADELAASAPGQAYVWNKKPFQVAERLQYDWNDQRSDLQFTLSWAGEDRLVFAESTQAGYQYFEERQLSPAEVSGLGLAAATEPPNIIRNADDKFYRRNEVTGLVHGKSSLSPTAVQYIYFRTTGSDRLRILTLENERLVYIQEPVKATDFDSANSREKFLEELPPPYRSDGA